jgi:hypothetical protein
LVTCAELPDLDPDDQLVRASLERAGVAVTAAVWDDPTVAWEAYDLVVLRSTWDYSRRRDAFVDWAAKVPRLANPAEVVAWNTDKRYLRELAEAGVPVVATTWVAPGDEWQAPAAGLWVIKPAVSAGSLDTGRYDCADPAHRALALDHIARLHASGRLVMVQPYLGTVDTHGETGLLYLEGAYSHAIRKGPMLRGPDVPRPGLYEPEHITPRQPSTAERAVADAALGALPFPPDRLLYARVDLLDAGPRGPVVIELELTEPSLFLATAAGSADRLAAAITRRVRP